MSYFSGLKNALPKLWNDRVKIVGAQSTKHGYITNNEDVTIVEGEPAKVVLKGRSASEQSFFGTDEYDAKLIIRNGIKIPAGADIYATGVNGQMTKYRRASKGYSGHFSHQEIAMARSEKA